ncbi:MAG TPA: hypothetical protein VGC39_05615 [Candidatus Methylacidiphilales bacterium]
MRAKGFKFLLGILGGVILSTALYFLVVYLTLGTPIVATYTPDNFIKAKVKIAQGIDKPKIIIAGGSSVDNGINAQLIQERTGIPTVNLGLWVSLGLEYIFEQVKRSARHGDTVVIIVEYNLYDWNGNCPYWVDRQLLPIIWSRDPDFVRTRPAEEQINFALRLEGDFFLSCLRARLHIEKPLGTEAGDFYRDHDACGDEMLNTEANRHVKAPVIGQTPYDPIEELKHGLPKNPKGFPMIASFQQWAQKAGVKVVATFPNLSYNAAYDGPVPQETEDVLTQFYASIQVPVIGHLRDTMYPPERFFDTHYHLLHAAALDRTAILIPQLTPYLPAN